MPHILPNDILLSVTEFIPDKTLRDCLGVNRLFFGVAMKASYKTAIINGFNCLFTDKDHQSRYLKRLRDPEVAQRVKKLKLNLQQEGDRILTPYVFVPEFEGSEDLEAGDEDMDPKSQFDSWVSEVMEHNSLHISSIEMTITVLTSVVDFSVWAFDTELAHCASGILRRAWSTFGHQLTKLTFQVPFNRMAIFHLDLLQGRCLRSITLDNSEDGQCPSDFSAVTDAEVLKSIGQLVYCSKGSLEILEIHLGYSGDIKATTGLQYDQLCPKLRDFRITAPPLHESDMFPFYSANSRSIEHLNLLATEDYSDGLQHWLKCCLSCEKALCGLKSLIIDCKRRDENFDILCELLPRMLPSLQKLEVFSTNRMTIAQFQTFCALVKEYGPRAKLEYCHFHPVKFNLRQDDIDAFFGGDDRLAFTLRVQTPHMGRKSHFHGTSIKHCTRKGLGAAYSANKYDLHLRRGPPKSTILKAVVSSWS